MRHFRHCPWRLPVSIQLLLRFYKQDFEKSVWERCFNTTLVKVLFYRSSCYLWSRFVSIQLLLRFYSKGNRYISLCCWVSIQLLLRFYKNLITSTIFFWKSFNTTLVKVLCSLENCAELTTPPFQYNSC